MASRKRPIEVPEGSIVDELAGGLEELSGLVGLVSTDGEATVVLVAKSVRRTAAVLRGHVGTATRAVHGAARVGRAVRRASEAVRR